MEIETVKYQMGDTSYLVNGNMSVPGNAQGNRHYRMVLEWIAEGNTVEPFETPEETIIREAVELEEQEWQEYLAAEAADKKDKWEKDGNPKFILK